MGLLLIFLTIVPFTIGQSTVSNLKQDCGKRFMCRICELSSGASCFLCPAECKAYYKGEKDKTQSDAAAARKAQTPSPEAGTSATAVPPPSKPQNTPSENSTNGTTAAPSIIPPPPVPIGRYTASAGGTLMAVAGAITAGNAIHKAQKQSAAAQGGDTANPAKPGPPTTASSLDALRDDPDGKDRDKKKKKKKCMFCRGGSNKRKKSKK